MLGQSQLICTGMNFKSIGATFIMKMVCSIKIKNTTGFIYDSKFIQNLKKKHPETWNVFGNISRLSSGENLVSQRVQ